MTEFDFYQDKKYAIVKLRELYEWVGDKPSAGLEQRIEISNQDISAVFVDIEDKEFWNIQMDRDPLGIMVRYAKRSFEAKKPLVFYNIGEHGRRNIVYSGFIRLREVKSPLLSFTPENLKNAVEQYFQGNLKQVENKR